MTIFHKTEVQMVILRCLVGLNVIWFKSYEKYAKMQKTHKTRKILHRLDFFYKTAKKDKMEIFVFFVITFEPIKIQHLKMTALTSVLWKIFM